MGEERIPVLIDTKLRRPHCVLLQAAHGLRGGRSVVSRFFNSRSWLVNLTDDMKIIHGTRSEWEAFAKEVNERFPLDFPTPPKGPA